VAVIGFAYFDGHLLLNLKVYDEFNEMVMLIDNNALAYTTSPWDIQFVGRRLTIREEARQLLFDIEFNPPSGVTIARGRFLLNGVELLVKPEYMMLVNKRNMIGSANVTGYQVGFVLGAMDVTPCAVRMPDIFRYLGDRSEAEAWAELAPSHRTPNTGTIDPREGGVQCPTRTVPTRPSSGPRPSACTVTRAAA
jgi:hypothetical protein